MLDGIAMAQRTILVVALDEITVATRGGIVPRPVTRGICYPLVALQIIDAVTVVVPQSDFMASVLLMA